MSHDHEHGHHHGEHDHHGDTAGAEGTWADPASDDPLSVSRRAFLATATVVAGAAAGLGGSVAGLGQGVASATDRKGRTSNEWSGRPYFLAGDHHIHTQFSPDAQYEIETQVSKAQEHGLDWVVITDHGSVAHQKFSIDQVTPRIEATRQAHPDMLVYQGLEWNIPGAEHATVFMPPGRSTVDILKAFEGGYDGSVLADQKKISSTDPTAAEPFAIDGLRYLEQQVRNRRTEIALMFANHPSRQGIDSPHEIRNWRETAPGVAVGMEGAPGHQAAGIPAPAGPGGARGYYDRSANANSFALYPPESYRTFGGFDWMTSTVGGLWDSLLAEGLPFWVTATSDSHQVYRDSRKPGGQDYATTGSRGAPVETGAPITSYGDFWPGQYSSTLVATNRRRYVDLMRSLQAGKVVAVHGRLIEGLDLRVRSPRKGDARGVTLGGTTWVRRGGDVQVSIVVELATGPNANGDVPTLAKVDLISGPVTGRVKDKDAFRAPETRVVETFEVRKGRRTATFEHTFRNVQDSFYLRLRGSDGKQLDSDGNPPMDVVGNANPWDDLWFYANPVFVDVV